MDLLIRLLASDSARLCSEGGERRLVLSPRYRCITDPADCHPNRVTASGGPASGVVHIQVLLFVLDCVCVCRCLSATPSSSLGRI